MTATAATRRPAPRAPGPRRSHACARRLRSGLVALACIGACAIAGCAIEPHLAPTPAIFKDSRLDFDKAVPDDLKTTRLPVFFATTRAAVSGPEHFGNDAADGVQLGIAQVRLGDPGWTWDDLMRSNMQSSVDAPRDGAVESVRTFGMAAGDGPAPGDGAQAAQAAVVPSGANVAGQDDVAANDAERAFVRAIDAQLARSRNQSVVVYVHGYRVTFDEVAVQMGSFSHYLGQAAVVTFQWPTGTNFWNYVTDCPRAERYIPDIEHLLQLVARTHARQVNVIAYSCGSPLLGAALARLRARTPQLDHEALLRRWRIGNVIFAASDVDLKTFAREHVQPALDLAQQVLVYFSRGDRALGFSSLVAGASRLGRPDVADLSEDEIRRAADNPAFQAIDVTNVRGEHEMGGMKGHGYWYANELISTDVTLSLRYAIAPANRCLVSEPGTRVWRIPENYVDCLATRLLTLYPDLRR